MAALVMTTSTSASATAGTMLDASAAVDRSWIRPWLRAEGAAVFVAGLAGFLALGLPWWAFAALLLVPDASAVGYLRGPRVGALV